MDPVWTNRTDYGEIPARGLLLPTRVGTLQDMPTATATPRITWTASIDGAAYDAFANVFPGSVEAARSRVLALLGVLPTRSQVERAIGRHAYHVGIEVSTLPQGSRNIVRRMERRQGTGTITTGITSGGYADPLSIRHYGIEVEFHRGSGSYNQRGRIVAAAIADGVEAYDYEGYDVSHSDQVGGRRWKMTTDATVTGGEIVSPIMDGDGASLDEVRKILRAVKDEGGSTGRNVGMHVHHDVRDLDAQQMLTLVDNLRDCQAAMMRFVPGHRYDGSNHYGASALSAMEFEFVRNEVAAGGLRPAGARHTVRNRSHGCPVGRYRFFNFNSVLTYGTVEFRALGNTLNPIKVRAWVEVGQALVAFSKSGGRFDTTISPVSPEGMTERLVSDGFLGTTAANKFVRVCATRTAR
jgi:hypothetical protein